MASKLGKVITASTIVTFGIAFGGLYWLYSKTPIGVLAASSVADLMPKDSDQGVEQLTLLGDSFSGHALLRDKAFHQSLVAAGIPLVYAQEIDQLVRTNRLNRGKADLIVTTLDQYLQQRPKGKIVALVVRSVGADGLVLNTPTYPELSNLKSLEQALGQHEGDPSLEFVFASDTASEYMIDLLQAQLPTLDLLQLKPYRATSTADAWQKLETSGDSTLAAMLSEPYLTWARQKGYGVAITSAQVQSPPISVIVASDELLEKHPAMVATFLEVYYRQVDVNVRQAQSLLTLIGQSGNLSRQESAAIVAHLDFFTAIEAKSWFSQGQLAKQVEMTGTVLALEGKIDQIPRDLNDLVNPDPIQIAAQNTQVLIDIVKIDNPELAKRLQGQGSTITID
jgi:OmpA-OmpF porin, OOP family